MRSDRRATVAGIALLGVAAALFLDFRGFRSAVGAWLQVPDPATGSLPEMAHRVASRADAVESLDAALGADPILSLALLAAGVGVGMIVGSLAAFVHQRRRIRRGERDA